MFLDELAKTFSSGGDSNLKITTKWDGAPAVFCGTYPGTNYFFVGTKSIFNKGAKVNFTPEDVIVVLLHDSGSRYLAKIYNDEWMKSKKFI